jgi:hypothetical protein
MLSSLDIVLNAPIGFIVAARVKLAIERGRQVNALFTSFGCN